MDTSCHAPPACPIACLISFKDAPTLNGSTLLGGMNLPRAIDYHCFGYNQLLYTRVYRALVKIPIVQTSYGVLFQAFC